MRVSRFHLAVTLSLAITVPQAVAASAKPPMPTQTIDPGCTWVWKTGGGIGVWGEDCRLDSGRWHLEWDDTAAGFNLMNDNEKIATVLQVFRKDNDAPASAILGELKKRGFVPDSNDCAFAPATIRPAPRTIAFYEIRPQGELLKAYEATPKDDVPDAPCPDYGWSAEGVRYFQHDLRQPGIVLYIDEGQDGSYFDPKTITFETSPQ